MAEFFTTRGIAHKLEEIIIDAKKELILCSPYLQIDPMLIDRMKDAVRRKVTISVVYRKHSEFNDRESKTFTDVANVRLYQLENLHSKCYMNEGEMIITSMNLYEYSERRNREMGIYFTKEKDPELFRKGYEEIMSTLYSAKKSHKGYCIRCSEEINYDPSRPLCNDCYRIWNHWGNENFLENFCHRCGCTEPTSKAMPLDSTCLKISDSNFRALPVRF